MKSINDENDFDSELEDPEIVENLQEQEENLELSNEQPSIIDIIESWEENTQKSAQNPSVKEVSSSCTKVAQKIHHNNNEDIESIYDHNFDLLREIIEEDLPDNHDLTLKIHSRCVNEILYEMYRIDNKSSQLSAQLKIVQKEKPRNNQKLFYIYEQFILLGKMLKSKEKLFIKQVPYALKKLEYKIDQSLESIEKLLAS